MEDDVVACKTVVEEKCEEVSTPHLSLAYLSLLIFVFVSAGNVSL